MSKKSQRTRRKRKKFIVRSLGGKCGDCQLETKVLSIYEVHHLDEDKHPRADLGLTSLSMDALKAELKKDLILLCANCHRKRHWVEGEER